MNQRTPPSNSNGDGVASPVDNEPLDTGVDLSPPSGGGQAPDPTIEDVVDLRDLPVTVEDLSGDTTVVDADPPSRSGKPAAAAPQGEDPSKTPAVGAQGAPSAEPAVAPVKPEAAPAQAQTAAENIDIIEAMKSNYPKLVDELADRFKVPEAELGLLDTDPAKFFARQQSRAYLNSQIATAMVLRQAIPQIVQSLIGVNGEHKANEDVFFGKYPDLKKPEYEASILSLGQAVKNADPSLSGEQLMDKVAAVVRHYHGLPNGQQPIVRTVKPRGFQPAAPGRGSGSGGMPQVQPPVIDQMFALHQMEVDE